VRLAPQELRTYFVTTVTANRRRLFQSESAANLMVNVLQEIRHSMPARGPGLEAPLPHFIGVSVA
jgi:REP element-mobilizing transposase RayT